MTPEEAFYHSCSPADVHLELQGDSETSMALIFELVGLNQRELILTLHNSVGKLLLSALW